MLKNNGSDLRVIRNEDLKESYDMTCEEFISYYSRDNIVIDLTGKIVVAVESIWNYWKDIKHPIKVLALLIPEEEKHHYKATLIYSGHIAFIKLEYSNGEVKYLIKDDECTPQSFDEMVEWNSSIIYECEENGFKKEDILTYIEMLIRVKYDYNFKLNKDDLILLEGL